MEWNAAHTHAVSICLLSSPPTKWKCFIKCFSTLRNWRSVLFPRLLRSKSFWSMQSIRCTSYPPGDDWIMNRRSHIGATVSQPAGYLSRHCFINSLLSTLCIFDDDGTYKLIIGSFFPSSLLHRRSKFFKKWRTFFSVWLTHHLYSNWLIVNLDADAEVLVINGKQT